MLGVFFYKKEQSKQQSLAAAVSYYCSEFVGSVYFIDCVNVFFNSSCPAVD
jgi:hypothetical protein